MSMSVSAVPSSVAAAALETDRAIAVMKKTRNVEQKTAESLIELVRRTPSVASGRIDTYA